MSTTTRRSRNGSAPRTTPIPTPKRFVRCIACGTWKKERAYALCAECWRVNGTLSRAEFLRAARQAEREGEQVSYRSDPRFERACRVYARRRQRREALAALDAALPRLGSRGTDRRDRYAEEAYDGIAPYALEDWVAWERDGVELPRPERSGHREFSEAEIAAWDARVDAWAAAHGDILAAGPAPELRPWGFWLDIDGVRVWTDDLA